MHPAHRAGPGTTTGDGKPRALNIKGPMRGHSISSNDHIREMKSQENQTVTTEKATGADAECGVISKKKERSEQKSDKHSKCHSESHDTTS